MNREVSGSSGRDFELVSDFQPAGDQPRAIAELVAGLERGDRHQTLLGVTGSGKTFTVACVVEAWAWAGFDETGFLFSDIEREHDRFSASAPISFTKP